MTVAEVHVKWSVILMDLLGPDIFSTLWMKGQVLHRERAHLKVPDWSLVWNELLTKKLPMFLSRLNEISGGCEKIVSVFESFWSNLKFLKMIDLTAWLWGWNVRVNGMRSVFSFSAVCSADFRSICWARCWPAWTTETELPRLSKNWHVASDFSEKSESLLHKRRSLRNWRGYGILDVRWMRRWIQEVTMWICWFVVNTSA